LDGLSHWVGVEVVHEKTVVVCEELTTEDGLVVASDVRVQIGYKKTAAC
jgi:hypothetical protein